MKLILKEKQTYDKINVIKDLLNYIQFNYDIDVTFDNRITNHYKYILNLSKFNLSWIIIRFLKFLAEKFDDVINALKFLITCGDEK